MPIRNRNTAGGGNQTNINGLAFENSTSLIDAINKHPGLEIRNENEVWRRNEKIGLVFQPKGKSKTNTQFYDYLKSNMQIDAKAMLSKLIHPDKVFFNIKQERFYVIECKYQKSGGSVDEKLQTFPYKRAVLNYLFFISNRSEDVEYVYVLNSSYFAKPVAKGPMKDALSFQEVFQYIREHGSNYYFDTIPLNKLGIY